MYSKPDKRQNPDHPIVGVGIVIWRNDEFLLIRRGKEPGIGKWSIPGGAQKLGETVFSAAVREVLEETGLKVKILTLVDVVDCIIPTGDEGKIKFHYTLIDVLAEALEGAPVAGDDAKEVGWFKLSDLPELGLWSETERIIRKSSLIDRN